MLLQDLKTSPVYLHLSVMGVTLFLFRIELNPGGLFVGLLGLILMIRSD